MNWENLKTNNCPYCGDVLLDDGMMMQCNQCIFKIEPDRMHSIIMHRAYPEKGIRMPILHWENLHDGKCPSCVSFLKPIERIYEMQICSNPLCTFRIRDDSLDRILNDDTHPANLFYKPKA